MSGVINKVHHALYAELAAIVGSTYTSDEDFVLLTYSRDTSPAPGKMQGIVVRPANTEQVAEIVKLANLTRTPIVPSGGRASYFGVPPGLPGRGIVVDMTRMNKILSLDEENMVVTAEAGIRTAELTTRCWEKGWHVHTAGAPWYPDTIGGHISGMQGGGADIEMASAGPNMHHIYGLKVVLPDGSVLQTGASPGSNVNQNVTFAREPGSPDITGMFIGDAGIFGIKVEATYRMYRLSKFRESKACSFDTFDEGWRFCLEISELEPLPYSFICMIPPSRGTIAAGGPDKWLVLVVVKGNSEEEVASKFDIIEEVMQKAGGEFSQHPGAISWTEEVLTGRSHRDMGKLASRGVTTYRGLIAPRTQAVECFNALRVIHNEVEENISSATVQYGITPYGSSQWLISSFIWFDGMDPKLMGFMRDLLYKDLDMGVSRGWFVDGSQGLGCIATAKYWSSPMSNYMRTLKRALDPNNIMNPGLWNL